MTYVDVRQFPHARLKLRVYDDAIEFRCIYKTVLGTERARQKVIGEDLEEGTESTHMHKTLLLERPPKCPYAIGGNKSIAWVFS